MATSQEYTMIITMRLSRDGLEPCEVRVHCVEWFLPASRLPLPVASGSLKQSYRFANPARSDGRSGNLHL